MAWPQATDYNAAVQNPALCFADLDLRQGQVVTDLLGLPRPHAGNFADVYQVLGGDGQGWAVKCFTREVPGLQARYQAVSDHLRQNPRAFLVDFTYLEEGIRLRGRWFPLVKMRWIEGFLLNEFLRGHADQPALLERLAYLWLKLARELREARIGHGDLQHGNVLLVPGSKGTALVLRLIDYDGIWVPALADRPSGEVGHPNYQHPQRLKGCGYSEEVDRFSQLAVYTALRCLRVGGRELWDRHDNGENLLFREADFRQPGRSKLWHDLWDLPDADARDLTGHLLLACRNPLEQVPVLEDLAGDGAVRPLNRAENDLVEDLLWAKDKAVVKVPPLPCPLAEGPPPLPVAMPVASWVDAPAAATAVAAPPAIPATALSAIPVAVAAPEAVPVPARRPRPALPGSGRTPSSAWWPPGRS
jgi:hypothetical protein